MRKIKTAILMIFFISGASGLIYEVVWTRMLTLVFGSTVFATTTVLTAYMAGLALGSFYFGRLADKQSRPLKIYAYLEGGIGLFAFIFPLILVVLNFIYTGFYHLFTEPAGQPSFYSLSLVRFILSFIILLIPTTFMGATLPIISKFFVSRIESLGWDVGRLYSVNTFGAIVGNLAAGFILMKLIGVRETLFTAGVFNLLVAGVALLLNQKTPELVEIGARGQEGKLQKVGKSESLQSRQSTISNQQSEIETINNHQSPITNRQSTTWALIAIAVSGFCALAYEVLWMRILVFFLGSTTYAFTTMLSAFLFGIAAGSAIFAKIVDKFEKSRVSSLVGGTEEGQESWLNLISLFGFVQILIGIFAIILLPAFSELYAIRAKLGAGRIWSFFACVVVMLLPTMLMGGCFPIAAKIYTRNLKRLGRSIGNVYSVNTLGSIFGSFVAGFIMIPLIGIQRSVIIIAGLNILIGYLLHRNNPESSTVSRWSAISMTSFALIFGFVMFILANKPIILKSAIFKIQNPGGELIDYEEDYDASVTTLKDSEGVKRLYVDTNQAADTSRWDSPSHRVIAHLPLLLHPRPKRALVVGFGMGLTSYSITQHGVSVDAVEISPGVVRSAKKYFGDVTHNVLENPLLNLIVSDGRNYILMTQKKYDMISTGIIHPLVSSGSSNIYSKDFYELCKEILTENGVMCQWVPLHRLPNEYYKMIIRTFIEVFPHTTLWYKYTPDFAILIGTREKLKIDFENFIARTEIPRIKAELAHDDLDGMSLLDSFFMGESKVREYVGNGEIHTDNHPHLEFFSGRLSSTTARNIGSMVEYREPVTSILTNYGDTPQERAELKDKIDKYFRATQELIQGQIYYARGNYESALRHLNIASKANPTGQTIKYNLNVVAQLIHEESESRMTAIEKQLLKRIRENPRDTEAYNNLGYIYQSLGKVDKAIKMLNQSLKYRPYQPMVYLSLGTLYHAKGDLNNAIASFKRAIELKPDLWRTHGTLGELYQLKGEHELAIKSFKKASELNPKTPLPYDRLGISYSQLGRYKEAEDAFKRAIKIDENFATAYVNLARLYIQLDKNLDEALRLIQKAIEIEPSADSYNALASVYEKKDMQNKALDAIEEAIKLASDSDKEFYRSRKKKIQAF